MDMELLDELCLGAGLEVEDTTEHPGAELRPTRKCHGRKDAVVAMEARGWEEKKKWEEEEERWRRLFPDIRRCVVVIPRPPTENLKLWGLKKRGYGGRSHDPSDLDWMQPLEKRDCGRSKRFVKKLEVRLQLDKAPENAPGRPQSRLRIKHCPDACFDSAHWLLHRHNNDGHNFSKDTTQMDHSYCLFTEPPQTHDSSSQSQDDGLSSCCGRDRDCCCASAEKKPPPTAGFRKASPGVQVEGLLCVTEGTTVKEEEEEEREEGQMKTRTRSKLTKTSVQKLKRRHGCGTCPGCVRTDCGKCVYCLDMRKFGGPCTKRQRCIFRRCLVVTTRREQKLDLLDNVAAGEEAVVTATGRQPTRWRDLKRWRDNLQDSEEEEEEEEGKPWRRKQRWARMWGEKTLKLKQERARRRQLMKTEQEVKKRSWEKSKEPDWAAPEPEWAGPTMGPAGPAQFSLAGGPVGGGASGLLTGTHVQLNMTLDSSHLPPSILTGSALTCLPGLLPQEGSFLHVSTGLTFIPPPLPPATVQPPQPKEEEEPVEINLYARNGTTAGTTELVEAEQDEEEVEEEAAAWSEGVSEEGKFFQVEVELPDSDEETLPSQTPPQSPSQLTDAVAGTAGSDVMASDVAYKPPEFISLSSEAFSLFGGGPSDVIEGGRDLLHLLRTLRRTVLPAHWVAVLADGPVLQLLQCSRLSSMSDTIIHVLADRCFYISVQSRALPDTHRVYETHSRRVTHPSQLVSLLLHLERLVVCRVSKVQPATCRSPRCHLLVAPPCYTCLPCLLEEEEEEEEEEDEEQERV